MAELKVSTGILKSDVPLTVSGVVSKEDFDKYMESNDNNIKEIQIKQAHYQATLEKNLDDMKKHLTYAILDNHDILEDNNSMINDLVVSLDQYKRNYDINNENNRKLFIILGITNIFTFVSLILIFITLLTL